MAKAALVGGFASMDLGMVPLELRGPLVPLDGALGRGQGSMGASVWWGLGDGEGDTVASS